MAYENLERFEEELKKEGLFGNQLRKTLDALRVIYMGQEKSDYIGTPHGDVDTIFENEISYLLDRGLIYKVPHTGIWDYGYRCTEEGSAIGSELTQRIIEENKEDIERFLGLFPKNVLMYWFQHCFDETDSGYLTTRISFHSYKYLVTKILDAVDVFDVTERVRKGLVSLDVAVKTYDGKITVIPPEFAQFLKEYLGEMEDIGTNEYGVYQTLIDYADRRGFSTRDELLERLSRYGWDEDKLEELVNETYELGLTSKYLRKRITTESDEEEEEDEEVKALMEEIKSEFHLSFTEDRPFRVYDRAGYEGYLRERFLEPLKESLVKEELPK
jgi:hypothetical protein